MKKKKQKNRKPRNFVAKNLFEFNKSKVEEDKRYKRPKHKNEGPDGPFSLVKNNLYFLSIPA